VTARTQASDAALTVTASTAPTPPHSPSFDTRVQHGLSDATTRRANYEHEIIGQEAGKLAPHQVEALMAELPTSFDEPRQQVVYELATTLAQAREVPNGMYQRAKSLLGDAGIVDVTVWMGWFTRALGSKDAALGVYELAKRCGAPVALKDIGMSVEDVPKAADIASSNPYWNPREIERDALLALLQDAFDGVAPRAATS
jgi:hypothetical protein